MMEMAMRTMFAHPSVQGVVFWTSVHSPCINMGELEYQACIKPCNNCFTDFSLNDNAQGQRWVAKSRMKSEEVPHGIGPIDRGVAMTPCSLSLPHRICVYRETYTPPFPLSLYL